MEVLEQEAEDRRQRRIGRLRTASSWWETAFLTLTVNVLPLASAIWAYDLPLANSVRISLSTNPRSSNLVFSQWEQSSPTQWPRRRP